MKSVNTPKAFTVWSTGLAQRIDQAINQLEKVETFVSGAAMVIIMLGISADATGRYLLNRPITGMSEFIEEYLMAFLVFLSLSFTFTQGGHVKVTVFLRFFPKPVLRWLNIAIDILGIAMFSLLTVATWNVAFRAFVMGTVSNCTLQYPVAPALFAVSIGTGTLVLRLLQSLLENLGVIKRSEHEQVEFAEI